jgi:hypothetical protein
MFIQTIQGHVGDAGELKGCLDQWMRDLLPGASGWLGTTAGVTADGTFVALARFESQEAAQHNSERPEQHQWWMETAKLFSGEVIFHDCREADQFGRGGSDQAGFVQVIQGRVRDVERMRELDRRMEAAGMSEQRPDVIGGIVALHGDGGYTMAIYFTSEEAAREGERKEPPPEIKAIFEEQQRLHEGEQVYLDLSTPWLYSR